jgi:MYXO-CTERM domain-containing protein
MTVPADDAGDGTAPSSGDGGGCSTTGSTDSNASGVAMMGLAGLGLALIARARRNKR